MQFKQYLTIDPHVLLTAAGDDIALFGTLSRTYLRVAPPMLERLEQAALAGDWDRAAQESHALKGTTSLVGAARLTQMVEDIGQMARQGDRDRILLALAGLTHEFGQVMQEVQESLRSVHGAGEAAMKAGGASA